MVDVLPSRAVPLQLLAVLEESDADIAADRTVSNLDVHAAIDEMLRGLMSESDSTPPSDALHARR